MTTKRSPSQRGFTLTELMVVVAIIGVLAVLAVVSYRKMVNSARISEATQVAQSIRVAQESYRAETGQYAKIADGIERANAKCPAKTVKQRATWDPTCNGGNLPWSTLPVHADGSLVFQYATTSGFAGTKAVAPTTGFTQAPDFGSAAPTTDWFTIAAYGDADDNGVFAAVVTTSWNNRLYVDNDGE